MANGRQSKRKLVKTITSEYLGYRPDRSTFSSLPPTMPRALKAKLLFPNQSRRSYQCS